ncbi:MAG TPA: hypothetical protein VFV52_07215 [Bacilli bacterium]|nr:hypothetical protein [Bacilli bacterium]
MWKFIGAGVIVALLVVLAAWATGNLFWIEVLNGYIGLALILLSSCFSYFMSAFMAKQGDYENIKKRRRPRWFWPLGLFLMAVPPLAVALVYTLLK